jgi:hypothetical protein
VVLEIGPRLHCGMIVPLHIKFLELSGTENKALRDSKAKDVTSQDGGPAHFNLLPIPLHFLTVTGRSLLCFGEHSCFR